MHFPEAENEQELHDQKQQRLLDDCPDDLYQFIVESNRIEGIYVVTTEDVAAHQALLALDRLTVADLELFVMTVATAALRNRPGLDVMVGRHVPQRGGPEIEERLSRLLYGVSRRELSPYEAHLEYEDLHPFMDGNGRSGRAVWAWLMKRSGEQPFALPFLHRFYYQTLDDYQKGS